jgi:molybdenum cofactor biosynthesis enzyme
MKVFLLLGILVASGLIEGTQKTLINGAANYGKLVNEARAAAINAAKNSLNKIRTDLDYTHEGTFLYNSDQLG